jgi:3-mercaptopyruvate sulfurtransferase SseA
MRLKAAGVDARFLTGGLAGWRAQDRPVITQPVG